VTASRSPATILVVDDNPANLLLTKTLLHTSGYLVEEAMNAEQALLLVHASRPDLILMDIQLPGQDGLTATRQLKSDPATSSIPVIALSAHALADETAAALAAGCDGYLTKPIDTRAFPSQIAAVLDGGSAGQTRL